MGRILNDVSQCTISCGASKDLILLGIVHLKPMTKAHSSGRMVSRSICDVVIACTHSENLLEDVDDDHDDYDYYNLKKTLIF